ncbi:MAG: SMC-Scp complex subunit ScpB [Verrucomicrobia bacterium]|nr:SMC-Scp complex subunit ScpB [Verrucomicrobiota bacterium]MBS0646574.1 SMC-Scp complex subunit ScpB [Verrucomicrobiota bacterium]
MPFELNLLEEQLSLDNDTSSLTADEQIKRILEAMLFSTREPLSLEKMRECILSVYPIRTAKLQRLLASMQDAYMKERRAFQIDEIAGGYILRTTEEMAPYLERLHQNRRGEKLTPAAIEVLAIIAYKGPITRPEIDGLRGVDSSGTLASLVERGLVEGIGRKESAGRPMQYATTTSFLTYFGLKNLHDLNGV